MHAENTQKYAYCIFFKVIFSKIYSVYFLYLTWIQKRLRTTSLDNRRIVIKKINKSHCAHRTVKTIFFFFLNNYKPLVKYCCFFYFLYLRAIITITAKDATSGYSARKLKCMGKCSIMYLLCGLPNRVSQ